MTSSSVSFWGNRRWPTFPSRITGGTVTTHLLLTRQSFGQLSGGFLKRRDLETRQRPQKIMPAEAGQFGRLRLRQLAQFVPLHRRRQPQFLRELLRPSPQRRQGAFRHFQYNALAHDPPTLSQNHP